MRQEATAEYNLDIVGAMAMCCRTWYRTQYCGWLALEMTLERLRSGAVLPSGDRLHQRNMSADVHMWATMRAARRGLGGDGYGAAAAAAGGAVTTRDAYGCQCVHYGGDHADERDSRDSRCSGWNRMALVGKESW